jgi:hypothetical protein
MNLIELRCEVLQLVMQASALCYTLFRRLFGLYVSKSRAINIACKHSTLGNGTDEPHWPDGVFPAQVVTHVSACCKNLQSGPPVLRVSCLRVFNDARKCSKLESVEELATCAPQKSQAQGVVHALAHWEIVHSGPPIVRVRYSEVAKGAHQCRSWGTQMDEPLELNGHLWRKTLCMCSHIMRLCIVVCPSLEYYSLELPWMRRCA